VARRFAGGGIAPDDVDVGDAIGELTNIVAGQVKVLLNKNGINVNVSLPTVVKASGLETLVQRGRNTASGYTHFDSPAGKLWTAVSVGLSAEMVL
jgi:CheY-specific phosphatase CheX